MTNHLKTFLPTECPWRDTLYWYDSLESTNTHLKNMAIAGAPEGTVVLSGHQTCGRGRMGRSFHSPAGQGIYLSLLLRPQCQPAQLMHLTCAVGVAVCNAIEETTGFRPDIKWINDLIANKKKLGGILTQLSVNTETGLIDYAIVGIGINCNQSKNDFPEDLLSIATSLKATLNHTVSIPQLSGAIIHKLWIMCTELLTDQASIMEHYRRNCITLNKDIMLLQADQVRNAYAMDIADNGCLIVRLPDGTIETINSGEASIRPMHNIH